MCQPAVQVEIFRNDFRHQLEFNEHTKESPADGLHSGKYNFLQHHMLVQKFRK